MSSYQDTAPAIYAIFEGDDIIYIGQSRNVKNRWRQHKGELARGTHENAALQAAYDQRGPSAPWRFTTLWVLPEDVKLKPGPLKALLTSMEQSYIDLARDLYQPILNAR